MKPVLIFRHVACEGPAYLARFLDYHGLAYRVVRLDEGEEVPREPADVAALVFMGGPMSVNDDLPWLKEELELIREACRKGIPVLGHCLGGQLISKALGGDVADGEKEFGWFPVKPHLSGNGPGWLADLDFSTEIFHWHGEQFSLPEGSTPLFSTDACPNQGFVMGNAMALQCHVEIEADDVGNWLEFYRKEIPPAGRAVQSTDEMQRDLAKRVERLQVFADTLYNQWLKNF